MGAPLSQAIPFLLGLLGYAAARGLLPAALGRGRSGGPQRANYRGEPLPTGIGSWLALAQLPGLLAAALLLPAWSLLLVGWAAASLAVSTAGLFDDLAGERAVKGLRGHLRELARGRLTAGGIKAFCGGAIGLGLALLPGRDPAATLLAAAVIALACNAVNALDLRPGRAVKGFAGGFLLVPLLGGAPPPPCPWLWPLLGAVAAYLPADLRGEAMLGDAGSNLLGLALGTYLAWSLPVGGLAVAALLLGVFQVWIEVGSLSAVIERRPLLRRLDGWGRPPLGEAAPAKTWRRLPIKEGNCQGDGQ